MNPILRDGTPRARDDNATLEEAVGLAQAISLDIKKAINMLVNKPVPSTLLGSGQVARVKQELQDVSASLVVVNHTLTPGQQRNLEKEWGAKVIDRTGLILEIFGERARTREGMLQVELAALSYQRSRLVRSWTHLERQRASSMGGFGFMGGPGESQLEIDRRLIGNRIDRIKAELKDVRRTRGLQRRARERRRQPVVALVGYTNAGKSTLFNQLTQAGVLAENMLFATLDPTMRQVKLGAERQIMLSDTVGFIADLPTQLVEAFRATLEEVVEADLILHVRDIAHADSDVQKDDVLTVLDELGIQDSDPRLIEVWNKIDLLPPERWHMLQYNLQPRQQAGELIVPISALAGEGMAELLEMVETKLFADRQVLSLTVPYEDGLLLAWLYAHGDIQSRTDADDGIEVTVELSAEDAAALNKRAEMVNSAAL